MNEILPVLSGLLLGVLCTTMRSKRWRATCLIALSIPLGWLATVISGESAIGWEFLYIDIPLVAGCAVAVLVLANRWKRIRTALRSKRLPR